MKKYTLFILFFVCTIVHGQRIVSLAPSLTTTLIEIGAEDNIVGRTSYCPAKDGCDIIGDALTVNIEHIIKLKADYIITTTLTSQKTIDRLKELKQNVICMPSPQSFEEICEQTIELGQLCNKKDVALQHVENERRIVDRIAHQKKTGKAFFQIGAKPIWGVTENSYLNDIIKCIGASNVLTEGNGMTQREHIVRSAPNYIIISTMEGVDKDEAEIWRKLTKASIILVDGNIACCPTPQNFRKTLESVIKGIE
ncbi:MAG: ABC transporter substrate-binding protein [Bacteroidales bacterium]|nr:ABC transporter substrate-binding protein [Bacteroidales bacterium]